MNYEQALEPRCEYQRGTHCNLPNVNKFIQERKRYQEAIKKAIQFIENGIEFGYIQMPEKPDTALETLPMLKTSLDGKCTRCKGLKTIKCDLLKGGCEYCTCPDCNGTGKAKGIA